MAPLGSRLDLSGRSDLGEPSRPWPWIVLMESRRGGLVIPEMRVGDEGDERLWLVVVGVDGLLVPVPARLQRAHSRESGRRFPDL